MSFQPSALLASILGKIPVIGTTLAGVVAGTTVVNPLGATEIAVPVGVEVKVTAATVGAGLSGLLVATIARSGMPAILRLVLSWAVPAIITALAGYLAPHTTRTLA